MTHAALTALAIIAFMALTGCVSSQSFSFASAADRLRVNDRASRSGAVVVLHLEGQPPRRARALHIESDSVSWSDEAGTSRAAPTSEVRSVTFRRDGAGALKGAALGAAVGGAIGYIAGRNPGDEAFITLSPTTWAMLGAANGVWLGALAGAGVSDRHVYRPAPPSQATRAVHVARPFTAHGPHAYRIPCTAGTWACAE